MEINEKLRAKIEKGRQYRAMTMDAGEQTEEKKMVRGYATTFEEPYVLWEDDDIILYEEVSKNAFDECNMDDVIFQYDHCGRVFARKSNGTLTVTPDDHGLLIEADLSGTNIGRDLYEEIKGGYTTKMSFGFMVSEDKLTDPVKGPDGKYVYTRTIEKISRLYDVSAVSLPANDLTEISARGLIDGVIEKTKLEELKADARSKARKKLELKLKMEGFT